MALVLLLILSQQVGAIAVNQADKGMTSEELRSRKIRREGKALSMLRTGDLAVPVILHQIPPSAQRGVDMILSASVSDSSGIALVRVYYRSAGKTAYLSREMTLQTGDIYEGILPGYVMIGEEVEYYFEAWDLLGNGPGLFGTDQNPHRIMFPEKKEGSSGVLMCIFLIGSLSVVAVVPRWLHRDTSMC